MEKQVINVTMWPCTSERVPLSDTMTYPTRSITVEGNVYSVRMQQPGVTGQIIQTRLKSAAVPSENYIWFICFKDTDLMRLSDFVEVEAEFKFTPNITFSLPENIKNWTIVPIENDGYAVMSGDSIIGYDLGTNGIFLKTGIRDVTLEISVTQEKFKHQINVINDLTALSFKQGDDLVPQGNLGLFDFTYKTDIFYASLFLDKGDEETQTDFLWDIKENRLFEDTPVQDNTALLTDEKFRYLRITGYSTYNRYFIFQNESGQVYAPSYIYDTTRDFEALGVRVGDFVKISMGSYVFMGTISRFDTKNKLVIGYTDHVIANWIFSKAEDTGSYSYLISNFYPLFLPNEHSDPTPALETISTAYFLPDVGEPAFNCLSTFTPCFEDYCSDNPQCNPVTFIHPFINTVSSRLLSTNDSPEIEIGFDGHEGGSGGYHSTPNELNYSSYIAYDQIREGVYNGITYQNKMEFTWELTPIYGLKRIAETTNTYPTLTRCVFENCLNYQHVFVDFFNQVSEYIFKMTKAQHTELQWWYNEFTELCTFDVMESTLDTALTKKNFVNNVHTEFMNAFFGLDSYVFPGQSSGDYFLKPISGPQYTYEQRFYSGNPSNDIDVTGVIFRNWYKPRNFTSTYFFWSFGTKDSLIDITAFSYAGYTYVSFCSSVYRENLLLKNSQLTGLTQVSSLKTTVGNVLSPLIQELFQAQNYLYEGDYYYNGYLDQDAGIINYNKEQIKYDITSDFTTKLTEFRGGSSLSIGNIANQLARDQLLYLTTNGLFMHEGPDGTYETRFEDKNLQIYGEVLLLLNPSNAYPQKTMEEELDIVFEGWMNSPGHKATLQRTDVIQFGYAAGYIDSSITEIIISDEPIQPISPEDRGKWKIYCCVVTDEFNLIIDPES